MSIHVLEQLQETLKARRQAEPCNSYVASLCAKGDEAICKKISEELLEMVFALQHQNPQELIHEVTDLWFHLMVFMVHHNLTLEDISLELQRRMGKSGLQERAERSSSF